MLCACFVFLQRSFHELMLEGCKSPLQLPSSSMYTHTHTHKRTHAHTHTHTNTHPPNSPSSMHTHTHRVGPIWLRAVWVFFSLSFFPYVRCIKFYLSVCMVYSVCIFQNTSETSHHSVLPLPVEVSTPYCVWVGYEMCLSIKQLKHNGIQTEIPGGVYNVV